MTLNADGSFTYTPAANFNGTDSFTYTASDGTAASNVATVTITVTGVNDAPVAVNDAATTAEDTRGQRQRADATTRDVDGDDADGERWSRAPAHGTVTLAPDGSFTYTPAANFNGTRQLHLHGRATARRSRASRR